MFKNFFIIVIVFSTFSFSKEYKIDVFLDEDSYIFSKEIINESLLLFPSSDKINFLLKKCKECEKVIKNSKTIKIIKKDKRFKSKKNTSFVTYNNINSIYDKNRLIRTIALTIYELVKQNKSTSVYMKNRLTEQAVEENSKDPLKTLNLKDIFLYIKSNNLDIKLNDNNKKLTYLDIEEAKSAYKPNINIYSNYIQIDKDRATYSNGQISQESIDSGIRIKQLIYSNNVLQNIKIKKLIYDSSKNENKALNDEITYKATLLYLNIIKAKKYLQIIKIKHKFISQNLEFARQRVEIGVQDRSDIFRWQSELSNVNIEVSNGKKQLKNLKIELSNLLQIQNIYSYQEYGMKSKIFKLLSKDAIDYLSNIKVQNSFVNELVHTHSRLKQLKEAQKAKFEELKMNTSSRYLPTLSLEGSAKKIQNRSGAGSNFQRPWDDEEYQAVINLNLPLYEGGIKSNKIQKNRIELINSKLNYKNVKNLIIENVRKNYASLSSSYEKINYSKDAEHSSEKNFELIQDKYKNGEENIISLLDAQNAYIVSKLNLNISITDYLSDLTSIYFFSGKIDILVDESRKKDIENKIIKIIKDEK